MKKQLCQLALILLIGIFIKWHLEKSIQASSAQLKLGGVQLNVELRSQLTQNLAIALLSGFRGIVADFVWVSSQIPWEEGNWFKMKEKMELAVVLQPHSISFWDLGAWNMAWNASYGESENQKYPSNAYRLKMQRQWIQAGKKFLEDGLRNNPDSYDLHFKLAWLIYQKLEDPVGAVPDLKIAASDPQAPLYIGRMVGHMYEKGAEKAASKGNTEEELRWTREAYEWWKLLWKQDRHQYSGQLWYKVEQWGREAEKKLKIPDKDSFFSSAKK